MRDLAPLTLAMLVPEPLVVPAAMPFRSIQALMAAGRAGERLRAAAGALRDPEVVRLLNEQGAMPGGNSGEEFGAFLCRENEK